MNRNRSNARPRRFAPFALTGFAVASLAALLSLAVTRADEQEQTAPKFHETPITAGDRDHWAFQPIQRPELPEVDSRSYVRNAIDLFVVAALEAEELQPLPEAGRRTLIRRLTFDFWGLPPTPKEVDDFLADRSPDAYERLVDRLLASHHYGERWGQHWLDLARFAETDGFEHDHVRENAWKYRDWVIDAFNRDMPYNQFVAWQLAGDEIAPDDPQATVATGFCLAGPDMPDINSQEERQHNLLNDMTGTVGAVFLALQMGCAQCHDHKYDPISQADFYRMRAVFQPAVTLKEDVSVDFLHSPKKKKVVSRLMIRGDYSRPGPQVEPAVPRIANLSDRRVFPRDKDNDVFGRREKLAQWIASDENPLAARVMVNRLWQHHFGRGLSASPSDFGIMGEEPTHPELLDYLASELIEQGWSLKHIHRMIANSSVYRRASGSQSSEWPKKTARQASETWRSGVEADPQNLLLWRGNRRRLEGEAIRDAMLTAAGVLSPARGGPGVMPPLPEEIRGTLLKKQWDVTENEAEHDRRSIYLFARRNLRFPVFEAFDRPDGNASCPQRNHSTTAPQSLLMLNSESSLAAARRLASSILAETSDRPSAVVACYRRALSREPSDDERQTAATFLAEQESLLRAEKRSAESLALPTGRGPTGAGASDNPFADAALVDFCLAIFNLNEFAYVD